MAQIDEMCGHLAKGASLEGEDGAIRITATCEPGAGSTAKISPSTYSVDANGASPCVTRNRYIAGSQLGPLLASPSRRFQVSSLEASAATGSVDRLRVRQTGCRTPREARPVAS